MIKPWIELITCESGDWKVLRMNLGENFKYEGHSIPNGAWIKLLEILGYEVKCISDEDMKYERY